MNSQPATILLIEDNPGDARLFRELLREVVGSQFELAHASRLSDGLRCLVGGGIDAALVDLALPDSQGLDTLRSVQMCAPRVPVVVLTGLADDAVAIAAMQAGAQDFLVKGQVDGYGLARAIRYAIERQRARAQFEVTSEALRTSKARLAAVIGSAMDAILSIDAEQRITMFNTAAERMFRCSAAEALGAPLERFMPARLREEYNSRLHSFEAVGETTYLLARFGVIRGVRADGEEFPIEASISQIETGGTVFYTAILRDITDRLRAEQVLLQKTSFIQLLQDIAVAANQAVSSEDVLRTAIHEICSCIDWPVGHVYLAQEGAAHVLVSSAIWHLADPERFAVFRAITDALGVAGVDDLPGRVLISGKAEWVSDLTALHNTPRAGLISDIGVRAGFAIPVLVGAEVVAVLEFFATEAHAPDPALLNVMNHVGAQLGRVVERERAQAAIEVREAHFRALIEHSTEGVSLFNAAGTILYGSPATMHILGYPLQEYISRSALEFVHPGDQPEIVRLLREVAGQPGVAVRVEARLRHANGSWRHIEGTMTNLLADPAVGAIVNNYRDITERKRMEDALREERALLARRVAERTADLSAANAELARAARLKDEFLASMSHELRTPLNAVLGLSEALREATYGAVSAAQDRALVMITESGRHLLELINDILDLAKIGAGKLELELAPVSVEQSCEACVRMIKQPALKKQLSVQLNLGAAPGLVRADPRRLKQILVNLLSNAVKFTPTGGKIGLEVVADPEAQVIRFSIWDTGIGIAPAELKRLFQPFVQLDSRLSREYQGTGLGLALVYRLTEMHGGSVAVSSAPGAGSRFTITLPWHGDDELFSIATGAPAAQHGARTAPAHEDLVDAPRGASLMILLAEDNEESSVMMGDYLTHIGYQVIVARNGAEAVAQAAAAHPALIMMDIQMPIMDGLEATRRIRAQAKFAATPIIALTALAMPGDRERCLEAGADAYMSKPISLRDLAAAISHYLQPSHASQRSTS